LHQARFAQSGQNPDQENRENTEKLDEKYQQGIKAVGEFVSVDHIIILIPGKYPAFHKARTETST